MMRIGFMFLAGLAGCSNEGADAFAEALPDDRLLIPLDGASAARTVGDASEYEALTRGVANDVNAFVFSVVDTVKAVTTFEPTWKDGDTDTALWGPYSENGLDSQLWVHREAVGYTWAIEVRATGSEDWLALVAGESVPDGAGGSDGAFAFDLDVAGQVDPASLGAGQVAVAYVVSDAEVSAEVAFDGVSGTDVDDLSGATQYSHAADGSGAMDLAVWADMTGNTTPELLILRSRWQSDEAGRGDAWVTEGDLGELVYTGTECWDVSSNLTFFEDNAALETGGDAASCVFDEAEFNESNGTL